jgi:hypothetical protein
VGEAGGRCVHFRRSGGIVAFQQPLETSIAIDEDEDEDASELARLARELPEIGERLPPRTEGADRYQYDITVEQGEERHEVTLDESQLPPEWRPLIKRLERRAMDERRRDRS